MGVLLFYRTHLLVFQLMQNTCSPSYFFYGSEVERQNPAERKVAANGIPPAPIASKRTYARIHALTRAHTHAYTRMHTLIHAYTRTRINARLLTYTHMYTYTHTYTCTHSHTCTHTKLHNVYNTTLLPLAHHHSNVLHYARPRAPYVKELTKVIHFTLIKLDKLLGYVVR